MYNKALLIGNLGRDAEIKTTTTNLTIASFSIATTHSVKKNETWVNGTTWHNIVLFKPSDFMVSNLLKGVQVHVEGRICNREYENNTGVKVKVSEIIAEKVNILSKVINREAHEPTGSQANIPESDEDNQLPF